MSEPASPVQSGAYVVVPRALLDGVARLIYRQTGDDLYREQIQKALDAPDWLLPLLNAVLTHADADCVAEGDDEYGCDACAWDLLLRQVPNRVLTAARSSSERETGR